MDGRIVLSESLQRGLRFIARVKIASVLRGENPSGEDSSGLVDASEPSEKLAVVKVSGDIRGMRRKQLLKMRDRGRIVSDIGAFQRQAVAGESVVWFRGDEAFENRAARVLRLGHGEEARIITASGRRCHTRGRASRENCGETPGPNECAGGRTIYL